MKAKRVGLTMEDGDMVTGVVTGGDTGDVVGSMGDDSSGIGSNGATCNGSTESRSTARVTIEKCFWYGQLVWEVTIGRVHWGYYETETEAKTEAIQAEEWAKLFPQ